MSRIDDEIDIGALILTLWRGKWVIFTFLLAFAVLGYLYATRVADRTYVSTATVAIEARDQQIMNLESVVSGISAEQSSLNTEMHVIRSRQLLEKLVEQENLLEDPEFNPLLAEVEALSIRGIKELIFGPPEVEPRTEEEMMTAAINKVLAGLSIVNPRESFVLQISFVAGSPENAARVANTVADLYINDQLVLKAGLAERTIGFLSERTAQLQRELGEAELAVKDFAASTELVSPETLGIKNRQVKELRERLEDQLAQQELQLRQIEALSTVDPTTVTRAELDVLVDARILAGYQTTLDGDINRDRLSATLTTLLERARASLAQSETQIEPLREAILRLEQEVDEQSQDLLSLQQLEREAEATREIYGFFLNSLKEAEVQQGTQQPDARLLSRAILPDGAASPRVMTVLAMAAILGGLIGTGLVLWREMRNQGVLSADELLDLTGHTVLGQIPLAPIRKRKGLIDYLAKRSASAFSESVRNLRTSVLLTQPDNPPKTILITSSIPGEGKTTVSISLATNLSGLGRKVLLVEADIRRRTFTEYFSNEAAGTLVDAVEKGKPLSEIVLDVPELGLSVLSGGISEMNAADFFSSPEFLAFLKDAGKEYDVVVLDAPPVLAVPDARIIAGHVDAVLFNCAWNQTGRMQIRAGVDAFDSINIPITGTILSKIDSKRARSYGNYGQYGTHYGAAGNTGYYDH